MAKIDDARYCILENGFMSAGASGVFKAFVPIPWLEIGALTWVVRNMCDRIVGYYGYEDLPGMDNFFAVVISEATNAKLASGIFDVIPGFNIGTNAIATFTLHAVTGIMVIAACELLDQDLISKEGIEIADRKSVSKIIGTVTSVVYDFARGDYLEALKVVKAVLGDCVPKIESKTVSQIEYVDEDFVIDLGLDEIKPRVLEAASNAAETLAHTMGMASDRVEDENLADYSVADVLEYNDFVKHIYEVHLDVLADDQPYDAVFAAAGRAYREIYARNCREGLWSSEKGFDDTLAYYVAGYAKKKTGFRCLEYLPQKYIAYELSRYLQENAQC